MYASVLYELREADFHEIRREYDDPRTVKVSGRTRLCHTAHTSNQKLHPIAGGDQESHLLSGGDQGPVRQESLGKSSYRIHFPETEDSDYTYSETL